MKKLIISITAVMVLLLGTAVFAAGQMKIGIIDLQQILQQAPQAHVVLVRTTGLWGSQFGWGIDGKHPSLEKTSRNGLKILAKNLLFFTPRRRVTVEIQKILQ